MKFYTILLFALLYFNSFGQEEEEKTNAVYLRMGIYEVAIGYQKRINRRFGWGIEFDYRPKFKESSRNNAQWASWSFAMEGFRVKPMINLYNQGRTYWSIFPSYRYLEADKLIYDPGHFGGSNTSDYAVYSQKNHEVGLNVIFNKPFFYHRAFEGYVGAGLQAKFTERRYSIQGSYSGQLPSNLVSHPFFVAPIIYAGIKIKFARF